MFVLYTCKITNLTFNSKTVLQYIVFCCLTAACGDEVSGSTCPCVIDARCSWTPFPIPKDYILTELIKSTTRGQQHGVLNGVEKKAEKDKRLWL